MNTDKSDFVVFILTHGRPEKVPTYKMLRTHGYTGRIVLVIDNEDKTADEYEKNFPGEVVMFDKLAVSKTFDQADNFDDRRAIVYARNACFQIAESLGHEYFIQMDDDYTAFRFRMDDQEHYSDVRLSNLDAMFEKLLRFYKSIPAKSIAMAQGGDFIGGKDGSLARNMRLGRKCMNSFLCSTKRPFQFIGRINEDVNTYTRVASTGALFFTVPFVSLTQLQTQSNSGGMTDIYLDNGTYIKSFYTIIFSPSCTKIELMGSAHRRLHHKITWVNAVPKILRAVHKK